MRFGVSIPPFTDAGTIVELGLDAETAGWDGVFLWDHVRWDVARGLDIHDPWVLLTAIAVRTERIRLGTAVTPLARRRPWTLAKQLGTLDHLSAGRTILGVGLGAPDDADFGDFGDEPDRRARARIVDEALPILDGLLRGGRVVHHGEHFDVEAELLPPPVQRPRPPIFVAGTHPYRAPLRRALQWDGFFPISYTHLLTPDDLATYLDGIERPPDWELYTTITPDHRPDEFEAVGVDWLIEGAWPDGDWVADLRRRIRTGPPA